MPRSFSNSSKTSSKLSLIVGCLVALAALSACGGSGGSGGPRLRRRPAGGTGTQEVCTATAAEADGRDVQPSTAAAVNLAIRKSERVDGNPRGRLFDALWLNASRSGRVRADAGAAGRDAIDVGEIAVVQDEGDLIESPRTRYDLRKPRPALHREQRHPAATT